MVKEKLRDIWKKAKLLPSREDDLNKSPLNDWLIFIAVFIGMTLIALTFRSVVQNPDLNITMFYILGNFLVARYTSGYIFGFLYAILSVLLINFLFTYPYHAFNLTLDGYPVTFIAMLAICLVTSVLTTGLKEQARLLIRQEEELMEAQKEKMRAYKAEIQKRGDSDIANSPKAVNFLLCVLMMTLAALFIIISKTQRNKRPGTILIFCLLLIADLLLQRFIIGWANASVWDETTTALQILIYAIPVIIGPIIQALLFGSYLAFIMAILVSMLSTLMLAEPPAFFVVSLASSVVAIYICDGAQNRYRVIIAGVVYGLVAAFSCLLIGMFSGFPMMIYGQQAIAAFLGGLISSIAVLGVLPIVETIFKCNSNISLLDYTDLNNKKARLLKLLQINAPGTYHHSVMVSYVAEAAAQAVKANSTICRVGALYHDIGKLSKPEFFSENQRDKNPHDMQNPSMSALIIKNHVPEGIAAAEVEKMPRQIIDAISQHHGTSIISYFFSKAKAKAGAKALYPEELDKILREEGIEESMYRHEGRKPQTVENAIIMIADSCEAASRSMKVVTKHGIETLVEAIVKGKMTDGQFDECPITVKQLSKIKKSVSRTLLSMLHSRVDYKQQ